MYVVVQISKKRSIWSINEVVLHLSLDPMNFYTCRIPYPLLLASLCQELNAVAICVPIMLERVPPMQFYVCS